MTSEENQGRPIHVDGEKKTLLLIGGGHAHVQVITDPRFRDERAARTRRVLLSNSRRSVYSGLVPAAIARLASVECSEVDMDALCAYYGVHFILGTATLIDAESSQVKFLTNPEGNGHTITQTLKYNVLSVNIGSIARPVRGMDLFHDGEIVPTRPIANLVRALDRIDSNNKINILVVGSGHAGIELALAVYARFPHSQVTIVGRGTETRSKRRRGQESWGRNNKALEVAAVRMRRGGITYFENYTVTELCPPGKALISRIPEENEPNKRSRTDDTQGHVEFDTAILATGAAPPKLLSQTDLPLSDDGWMVVDSCLKSLHPKGNVFAAGDCISIMSSTGTVPLPKAGVFAVREGPVLSHNLCVALSIGETSSGTLRQYIPQTNFLSLLSTGDGRAIGTKYGIAFSGSWVFRLKMYIDEAWQARFRVPNDMSTEIDVPKFEGTALEAAAALVAADDTKTDDCFDIQLAVLKRMDADQDFRDAVIYCVQKDDGC